MIRCGKNAVWISSCKVQVLPTAVGFTNALSQTRAWEINGSMVQHCCKTTECSRVVETARKDTTGYCVQYAKKGTRPT